MITARTLPASALLATYRDTGAYTDCYATEVAAAITQAEYVEAFYCTWLFKIERRLLALFVHKPSSDTQARELATGAREAFAAWTIEGRAANQLLLCDYQGRTRSWLMSEPLASGGTRLYFGSAVVPLRDGQGQPRMGAAFRALLGFHKLYSRLLLGAAAALRRDRVGGWPRTAARVRRLSHDPATHFTLATQGAHPGPTPPAETADTGGTARYWRTAKMTGIPEKTDTRQALPWRQALWGGAAFLLLLPLLAMQFTAEVDWDAADFILFGIMLAIAGGLCELAVWLSRDIVYRIAAGIAVGAGFLLVWANVAVGVIGDEGNPINLMFFGVLAVGFFGALVARFRPRGMALAMAAMALAQLAVAGFGFHLGERYTVFLILFWVAAWGLSAVLFRKAAQQAGAGS